MIITYKYYDGQKRRLAISASHGWNEDKVVIRIISCSRKDTFNKKKARKALEDLENKGFAYIDGNVVHPKELEIPLVTNLNHSLKEWADRNPYFYRLEDKRVIYEEQVLKNKNNFIKLNRKIPFYKFI